MKRRAKPGWIALLVGSFACGGAEEAARAATSAEIPGPGETASPSVPLRDSPPPSVDPAGSGDSTTLVSEAPASGARDALRVGVLFRDGAAVSIAGYEGGTWTSDWSSPVAAGDGLPSIPSAPDAWHAYVSGAPPAAIHFVDPVLVRAYCGRNWAYRTDWAGQQPPSPRTRPEVVGMILSEPLPLLSDGAIPDLGARLERLGLVSNEVSGEGYRSVRALGYFRLDDRLDGVFLWRGYEGEVYRIYDLDADRRTPVAELHGGGC